MRRLSTPLLIIMLCHSFEAQGIDAQQSNLHEVSIPNDAHTRAVPTRPIGGIVKTEEYFASKPPATLYGQSSADSIPKSQGGYSDDLDKLRVGLRGYYQNDVLAEEKLFSNGKLHGIWRQYHENGAVFSERPYRNGKPDGVFKFWNEKGKLLSQSTINDGTGVLQEHRHPQFNSKNRAMPFVNGRLEGLEIVTAQFSGDTKGSVGRLITAYKQGIKEGWSVQFRADKSLRSSAYFHNNKLHGVYRLLDDTGELLEGYPRYFISGKEVAKQEFAKAAKTDALLQASLNQDRPEKVN